MTREIKFEFIWDNGMPKRVVTLDEINQMGEDFAIVAYIREFTGLLDKSGKEIYEGDIVSLDGNITADNSMGVLPNGWTFDEDNKYAIKWGDELAGWELDMDNEKYDDVKKEFGEMSDAYIAKYKNHARGLLLGSDCEVIGNIYENKELAK